MRCFFGREFFLLLSNLVTGPGTDVMTWFRMTFFFAAVALTCFTVIGTIDTRVTYSIYAIIWAFISAAILFACSHSIEIFIKAIWTRIVRFNAVVRCMRMRVRGMWPHREGMSQDEAYRIDPYPYDLHAETHSMRSHCADHSRYPRRDTNRGECMDGGEIGAVRSAVRRLIDGRNFDFGGSFGRMIPNFPSRRAGIGGSARNGRRSRGSSFDV